MRFDLIVDLQGLLRSGVMALASGAPRRVGLSTAREGAVHCYTDVVTVADFNTIHAVDRYWLIAQAFGMSDLPKRFHVPISEGDRQWTNDVLRDLPRPWLMVAAGSRWITKRWPPAHFAALLLRAHERFGGSPVFVGGREDVTISQEVTARLPGPAADETGRTTLPRLAALLARADVVLANDTGPLHLAVALGRPIVAPYTCTRVLLNGPYGMEANAVETEVWCKGSYLQRCPRLDCMAELTPERLWPRLEEILLAWQESRRSA
jgi:ADP-heptose:LPS heptosyltransferase